MVVELVKTPNDAVIIGHLLLFHVQSSVPGLSVLTIDWQSLVGFVEEQRPKMQNG